jgi:phosphotransacetylase
LLNGARSIAEATEKAATSATLLGEELRKATLSTVNELSNSTTEKTNQLAEATSQRLDEVLRAFKESQQK